MRLKTWLQVTNYCPLKVLQFTMGGGPVFVSPSASSLKKFAQVSSLLF